MRFGPPNGSGLIEIRRSLLIHFRFTLTIIASFDLESQVVPVGCPIHIYSNCLRIVLKVIIIEGWAI